MRVLEVTASARALPLLMKGMAVLVMSNMKVTLPLITSIMAGELPRYGTCSIDASACFFSSSADRWLDAPMPADPNDTASGCARA
ncbi:hypothetical protein D3C71_1980970 [compost metagenome]